MLESTQLRRAEILEKLLAYQETVFFICLGFARNYAEAEELTQEVYLKALEKIGSLKDPKLMKVWLFRIARNTCLDYLKKTRIRNLFFIRPRSNILDKDTPETQIMERERTQFLKKSIQRLPKKNREVFVLREYGELSYQEIAETLRLNNGTVMSRLNRARRAIMGFFQEGYDERKKGNGKF